MVKVGDKVSVTLRGNPPWKNDWNGERTVVEVQDEHYAEIHKFMFGNFEGQLISVLNNDGTLGDIRPDEYEVIE